MALTEEQKRAVRADFVTWSQGELPSDSGLSKVTDYVVYAAPRGLDPADLTVFFREWIDELAKED